MSIRLETITNSLGMQFVLLAPDRYSAGSPAAEQYRHRSKNFSRD